MLFRTEGSRLSFLRFVLRSITHAAARRQRLAKQMSRKCRARFCRQVNSTASSRLYVGTTLATRDDGNDASRKSFTCVVTIETPYLVAADRRHGRAHRPWRTANHILPFHLRAEAHRGLRKTTEPAVGAVLLGDHFSLAILRGARGACRRKRKTLRL